MKSYLASTLAAMTTLAFHATPGHAQFTGQQAVYAASSVIPAFGYGAVTQQIVWDRGLTGNAWCTKIDPASTCVSISGDGDCTWQVAPTTLVSCNHGGKSKVDESKFMPVICNNNTNKSLI